MNRRKRHRIAVTTRFSSVVSEAEAVRVFNRVLARVDLQGISVAFDGVDDDHEPAVWVETAKAVRA